MSDPKISASGELPLPAGPYSFSRSGNVLQIRSSTIFLELSVDQIAKLAVGWAVPGKGGGYVYLSAIMKDGSEKQLFESAGYAEGLLDRYLELADSIAGSLGVKFKTMPMGADA